MKIKTQYSCQNCGYTSAKWLGRCSACGGWNTFVEERPQYSPQAQASSLSSLRQEFRDAGLENAGMHGALMSSSTPYVELDSTEEAEEGSAGIPIAPRLSTGIGELDRVLGGGMA